MLKGRIAKAEGQHATQRAAPLPHIPARQHLLSLTRDVVAIHDKLLTCEERVHAIQSTLTAADKRDEQHQQQPTAPLTGNLVEHLAEYPGEVTAYLPDDHQQLAELRDSIVSTVHQASDSRAQHEAFLADLQHLGRDMDTTLQKVLSVSKEVQETAAAEEAAAQQRRKQRKGQLQLRLAVKQLRRDAAAGADVDSSARALQHSVSSASAVPIAPQGLLKALPPPGTPTTAGGGGGVTTVWEGEASELPEDIPRVLITGTPAAAASLAAPVPMTPPTPEATAAAAYVAAYSAAQAAAAAAAAAETEGGGAAAAAEVEGGGAAAASSPAALVVQEAASVNLTSPPTSVGVAVTEDPEQSGTAAAAAADAPPPTTSAPPAAPAPKVQLSVAFKCPTDPGQRLYVVGSHPDLGSWDTAGAVRMKWHEGHVWRACLEVDPHCGCIEFKAYVVAEGPDRRPVGKPVWERGPNRKVEVAGADVEVTHRFTAR